MEKEKDILAILPKFPQWESIPYAFNFACQDCGCSMIDDIIHKPNLVGWCETSQGYMLVFECPVCFNKFRCHCNTGDKFDKERFEQLIFEMTATDYSINNAKEWFSKLFGDLA